MMLLNIALSLKDRVLALESDCLFLFTFSLLLFRFEKSLSSRSAVDTALVLFI